MREQNLHLEVLDLTHDLRIPVFSANLFRGDGESLQFRGNGFGCHVDPRIALDGAVSELGQSWNVNNVDDFSRKFQSTPLSRELFLQADQAQTPKILSDFPHTPHDDFLDDIHDMMKRIQECGMDDMLVMDLTRPDVAFPVVRVIVPGMVHFWPRLGCPRLYEVPKKMGWNDCKTREEDLNPIPFYW